MKGDRRRLYESADDFFELKGSVIMKLTSAAALEVSRVAAEYGLIVARVEGGIWRHPGFEARLDCIWNGADSPISLIEAAANNAEAAEFIEEKSNTHDVFILTAPPVTGWPHEKST